MRITSTLLAVCCLLSTAAAQLPWSEEAQRTRASVHAREGLGALGGTACGAGCSFGVAVVYTAIRLQSLSFGFGYGEQQDAGLNYTDFIAAAVCAAIVSTGADYGVAKAGEQLGENGSGGWGFGGALAGAAVGAGIVWLGSAVSQSAAVRIPSYVLGGLTVPVGAVVGYNLGPRREASPFRMGSRLHSPGVALTPVELPDHSVEYGVKVQLAGLEF